MKALSSLSLKSLVAALAGIGFVFTLTGCMTEPITGRKQFILTSASEETTMSLDAWKEVLQKEKPSTNKSMIAAVERVGKAVAAVAEKPDFQWEFRCLASPQANAFCLPGGKVAVYEGLFQYTANDAELAAVVGHEVGHAIARHGGERMTEAMGVSMGAAVLSAALGSKNADVRNRWLMAYSGITTVGVILPFSRTHEYAADEIGLILMARAGYDPNAAIAFWQKFGAAGSGMPELLSTHPVGANRLAGLNQLLPKALSEYNLVPAKRGLGQSYSAPAPAQKSR